MVYCSFAATVVCLINKNPLSASLEPVVLVQYISNQLDFMENPFISNVNNDFIFDESFFFICLCVSWRIKNSIQLSWNNETSFMTSHQITFSFIDPENCFYFPLSAFNMLLANQMHHHIDDKLN